MRLLKLRSWQMGALGALFIKTPVLLSGSNLAVSGCVQEAAGFHQQSSGGVGEALTGDTGAGWCDPS